MFQNNIFDSDSTEQATEQREYGRIGGMMDGYIVSFGFRGLKVRLNERLNAAEVLDPETGEQLGGALSLHHATLLDVHEWLENKADYYEVA